MKRIASFVSAAWLSVAACGLDVPDLNNLDLADLEQNPTRANVRAAATGLLIGHRVRVATTNGMVSHLGIVGRESFNFDTDSDPRFISELLSGALDAGSPAFGGNFWLFPYANVRNANVLLSAVGRASELSAEEKEAVQGFAKTMQALDFLVLINTRDANGAAIDVAGDVNTLGAIVCRDGVLTRIAALLDQGKNHLLAAGATFPFTVSSGFSDFATPQSFLELNRGIKARVDVYRGNYAEALLDLGESFAGAPTSVADLNVGAYHAFSTRTGDTVNDLLSPNIYAHPSFRADQEPGDARVLRKLTPITQVANSGLKASDRFTLYDRVDSPVPIQRREELILLRAEANIGLFRANNANTAARDAAIADINTIRSVSGGLGPKTVADFANADALLLELLHQKRYSLMFEGGHRWIDLRRYRSVLPRTPPPDNYDVMEAQLRASDVDAFVSANPAEWPILTVNVAFPIPIEEVQAREGDITCKP